MRQKVLWSGLLLLFFVKMTMAQVTGKVEDEYGPLRGAIVSIVGGDASVETDEKGAFSIKGKLGDVLKVTDPVLFSEKEFPIKAFNMGTLKLKEKTVDLKVVVAFGKQKKENLTGSVAVVDSKAFESRPVSNAIQALQGQVAGMNFDLGNSGTELGESPSFNLRGKGTIGIGSSASPLVLIDGTEGDLSTVNPQDIESISVLKDAASASVYGSRAAFGVILVTTKSGTIGKVSVNYNNSFRYTAPTLLPKMLDSETFAYYWNESLRNDGTKPRFNEGWIKEIIDYKNGVLKDNIKWREGSNEWYTTRAFGNTDWYNVFYRDWSPAQEHNLTVRGGNKGVTYYLSGNYLGQEGLLRYNTDTYNRYSLNGKIKARLNEWVEVEYNNRFFRDEKGNPFYLKGPKGLFYHNIIRKFPTYPVVDPNGNYLLDSEIPQLNMGRDLEEKDVLTQNLNLKLTPVKDWNIYMKFTYRTDTRFRKRNFNPIYQYNPNNEPYMVNPKFSDYTFGKVEKPGMSGVEEISYKANYFSPNIYTDYARSFGLHDVKLMTGFQSELYQAREAKASRDGLLSDKIPSINVAVGENPRAYGKEFEWATMGVFGRLNYSYADRYLLEFNLRYDGTSRFLRDQRWNWYPSASIGWNVAKEPFWSKISETLEQVNTFKFRASYGELGNQQTWTPYPFYQNMPIDVNKGMWLINGLPTNTASEPKLISSLLTWESVATTNIGLDISAFKNRLDFSLDFFRRQTKNMTGPAPQQPAVLGAQVPLINNTDLDTRGFELVLGWRDKIGKDFSYSVKGTLSDSRGKVVRYPNETGSLRLDYRAGAYLGEIWGFETEGIAKTNEEMIEWQKKNDQSRLGTNWGAGDIMYRDLDGDGKVFIGDFTESNPGDLRIIGNETPRYNFGLDISMKYKGFDFRAFFQGVGKRDLALRGPLFEGANVNMWQATGFVQHLDYFRPADTDSPLGPNLDAYYPRPQFNRGWKNFYKQTRFLQDGAYIRLKNIQLGYTLPKKITQKVGIGSLRIYVSGENMATWTNLIDIFDPEAIGETYNANGKMYPMSKVLSTGLSINF